MKTERLEHLKKFIRTEAIKYLDKPNITSVGIGFKIKNGKPTKQLAIQFTVDRKVTPEALEGLGTPEIPKSFMIDGVPVKTDVIERRYAPSFQIVPEDTQPFRKSKQDPVMPGISVANINATAGTLGCIVYDRETGTPYMLSNWHVLHGRHGAIGDTIVQPGPYDDNTSVSENAVGALVRSHLGLAGDCAVASITEREYKTELCELGVTPRRIAKAELGDKLVKSGRTTAVTHGVVTRIEVTTDMDYGEGVGSRRIGSFEIGPDPDFPAERNEISMGGDSGSLWIAKDEKTGDYTDVAVGLHFAGERSDSPEEFALACNVPSVLRKLNVGFATVEAAAPETLRSGYDPDFLGFRCIPLPRLTGEARTTALEVDGENVIDYHHFSLVMSRARRMAIYTAHNVDGARTKRISRRGVHWQFDDRLDRAFQVGNEAYADNPWDRGHLVRRAAVNWGTLAEARRANRDSFHYTNSVPQHEYFNQDEWVHLEDWVLDGAKENNYRLCVFTGPVYTSSDRFYRQIQIPAAFWKIIGMQRSSDDELSVTAFLMNQYEMLSDDQGRRYLDLQLYQVPVEAIENLTGLRFDGLRESQPEAILEALALPEGMEPRPWSVIANPEDIVL